MGLNEGLEIDGPISRTAIESFYKAQDQLLIAHPHLKQISLNHTGPTKNPVKTNKPLATASFFSGGLDSVYTAQQVKEIDTLIAVWGFDIALKQEKHWILSSDLIKKYAETTDKKLILIKTNIREISNGLLSWGADYHGSALAGVANSLANHLDLVYVSATHSKETKRWGQFPSLSKAFTTDYLEVQEYGPQVRTEKALSLANKEEATLIRVCFRNKTGLLNCGQCQKCLRTKIEFSLVNAKYRPVGLETAPTLKQLVTMKLLSKDLLFFTTSIRWAKKAGYPKTFLPLTAVYLARLNSKVYYRLHPDKKYKP